MTISINEDFRLNKVQMKYLKDSLIIIIDELVEDINGLLNGEPWSETNIYWLSYFPEQFKHHYDVNFVKQILDTAMAVYYKLTDKEFQWTLNSVAEELVLNGAVNKAIGNAEIEGIELDECDFYDNLFFDLDFEMLFNPELDGIEDDVALTTNLGISNLSFKDWFKPYREIERHKILKVK